VGAWLLVPGLVLALVAIVIVTHHVRDGVNAGNGSTPMTGPPLVPLTSDEVAEANKIALSDSRVKRLDAGHSPSVANTYLWNNNGGKKIGAVVFITLSSPINLPPGLPNFPPTGEDDPLPVRPDGLYVTIPMPCTVYGSTELEVNVDFRIHAVVAIADHSVPDTC
jgi:hypothetical protein